MKDLEDCTVCRLCLVIVSNTSEDAQSIERDMQEYILPGIDLDLTCEPKICQKCSDNLQTCYEFKSICLKNGAVKKSVIEPMTIPGKTMNTDPQPSELTLKQELRKCCLCHIAIDTVEELETGGDHFLKTMLKKCFPEIKFEGFSQPCEKCLDCLENLFMFTTSCLNTEENIKSYCFTKGIHSQSKIDLQDVYCFIQSSIKIENEANSSKIMSNEEHHSETEGSEDSCDSFIKEEPKLEEKNEYCVEPETIVKTNTFLVKEEKKPKRKKKQYTKHINKTELEDDKKCPKGRNTIYKCTTCCYETNRISNMKSHLLSHKDSPEKIVFKCDLCSYKSKCKTTLNTHKLLHRNTSEAMMFKCALCKFESKYKRTLKAHVSTHKSNPGKQTFSCSICKYQTQNKYSFKRHEKVHVVPSEIKESKNESPTLEQSDVKLFSCNVCEYQTEDKYYLEEHKLLHQEPSEDVKFKCDICSYETVQKREFKRHMAKHKSSSEITVYKCDACRFKTKHKCTLETHMLKHKDIKMYSCSLCKYETKNKSHFMDHGLVHKDPSEIKMFKCHVCSHETKRKRDLNKHILRHTKS